MVEVENVKHTYLCKPSILVFSWLSHFCSIPGVWLVFTKCVFAASYWFIALQWLSQSRSEHESLKLEHWESGESQRYYACLFVDRSVVWIPKLPSLDWNLVLSDHKLPAAELFDWEFIILILAVECSYVHDWWSINFVIKVVILESWWLSGTVWILSIWRRYLLSQFKLLFDWFWIGTA